jgi:two-component system, chemotaxis family, chemotaxis protein CheY
MDNQAAHTIVALGSSGGRRLGISQTLRDGGYQVLEAKNGQEALEILEAIDAHLVIVDMSESDLGTLVFMRCMENDPAFNSVRMVLVTSETQDFKEMTGDAVTVSIKRPFTETQLLSAVDALLRVNGFQHHHA